MKRLWFAISFPLGILVLLGFYGWVEWNSEKLFHSGFGPLIIPGAIVVVITVAGFYESIRNRYKAYPQQKKGANDAH